MSMVKPGTDFPPATVLMMPLMPSWPPARWCATTPTVHFSDVVVFFQSASLRRSNTPVASCTFCSNCFASASALAAMVSSSVRVACGGLIIPDDTAAFKSPARRSHRAARVVNGRALGDSAAVMKIYAFDLMPWPHLAQASYYPDPNRLYDPALGRQVYDEHFRQMELYEECGYDRVSIWPRPLQQPHPPILLPADSDEGLEIAASRRVPTGSAYRSVGRVRAVFDRYRELARKHGWAPGPEHCHLVRHVYVAETNARAREEAEPHLDYFWQKLLSYHRGSVAHMGPSAPPRPARIEKAEDLPLYEFDFDLCQKEGLSIVGDPDHVVREIRAQARELGVGVLVGLFQFGSMPHALAVKNIRLFGEKVLPALKRD